MPSSSSSSCCSSRSNSQTSRSNTSRTSSSSSSSSSAHEEHPPSNSDDEELDTIASDLVVTKYKMAGDIVNYVLRQLILGCEIGTSVLELCVKGDSLIREATGKVFKRAREVRKGIAFPTCISVNNCVGYFTPSSQIQDILLKNEDLVKIELGAHVDGYIATVAHTIVVGASPSSKVKGKKADAVLAAHYASEAALRLLKPGNDIALITSTVQSMSHVFNCKTVMGILSHKLRRFNIHGSKVIAQNPDEQQKEELEPHAIRVHEVYAMNVVISSGEGVPRPEKSLATVYKKTNKFYKLKQKSSRTLYADVTKNYGQLPFNIRDFEKNVKAKLGLSECVNHNLIEPLLVAFEKVNDYVASFMFTVLLMPNGPHKITGIAFEKELFESEYSYLHVPSLKQVMSQTGNPMKAQKKKARRRRKKHLSWD